MTTGTSIGKLKLQLRGPMLVIKLKKHKYTLQNITNGEEVKVYISRVVPFYYDPYEIDEEEIHSIVDHNPDISEVRDKRDLMFHVKWKTEQSKDSWLPWKALYDNTYLHKYLNENNMSHLIPKKFRNKNNRY